jgi:hypothetical protein
VADAAPRLEQLYARLRRDFGLAATEAAQVIPVEVVTEPQPPGLRYMHRAYTLIVPSPALLEVPLELEAGDALYQAAVYPLASLVLREVQHAYPPIWMNNATHWWPLLAALPLWAVWDEGGPLAASHADIVRWLLHNAQASAPSVYQTLPDDYARLCAAYQVWHLMPADMGIPLACTAGDTTKWSKRWTPALPLRLDELPTRAMSYSSVPSYSASQMLGMATLIEYVVATYGRAALPRLVTALGEHAGWHTLIPAVFGVSAAEFEAGWHAYLAALDPETP